MLKTPVVRAFLMITPFWRQGYRVRKYRCTEVRYTIYYGFIDTVSYLGIGSIFE